MGTQNSDDSEELPLHTALKEPPSQRGREASAPPRTSVLIVDRARLEREALVYFLHERAPDLDVRAIEAVADAPSGGDEAPDVILVSLKDADINPTAIRQAASELEAAFGRKAPTILILQGESSAADELAAIRLGMQGASQQTSARACLSPRSGWWRQEACSSRHKPSRCSPSPKRISEGPK
jgi:hypothetical protein